MPVTPTYQAFTSRRSPAAFVRSLGSHVHHRLHRSRLARTVTSL